MAQRDAGFGKAVEGRAEPATAADEAALDMAGAGAVLVIEETAFDQSGRAVIRAWHRAVTDELMYVNEVN